MTDTATLQARLTAAEEARHDLIMGTSAVAVMHKGKSVTFRKTDLQTLEHYIRELKCALGLPGGEREPPLRVFFR